MKVVRVLLLIPAVMLLAIVTSIGLMVLCIEMTFLNPSFGISAYEAMDINELIMEEIYEDGLEKMLQSAMEDYEQQSSGAPMLNIDSAQLAELLRKNLPREDVSHIIDDVVIGVYSYVMMDDNELPVLDIQFIIDGISRVIPEVVDGYLSDYYLPDTRKIADYLEKGHASGIINRYSIDWIMGMVMSSDIDMKNVDEERVKDFLAANEDNFKKGTFDAEALIKTYTETMIMQQLAVPSFEGSIPLETVIEDGFEGMAALRQLKNLRKTVVTVAHSLLLVLMIGLLLLILLLTPNFTTFLKVISIMWLLVGGIQLLLILFDSLSSLIEKAAPKVLGFRPMEDSLSELQMVALKTGVLMVNQVVLLVFGLLVLIAVMLWISGIILERMLKSTGKETTGKSLTLYVDAVRLLGAVAIYIALFMYITYSIKLLKQ